MLRKKVYCFYALGGVRINMTNEVLPKEIMLFVNYNEFNIVFLCRIIKIKRRKEIMQLVKDFFKSRRLGFYFTVAAVLLALIQVIIYAAAFSTIRFIVYKHWSVILFSVFAILAGIGLSCTKWTETFAPVAILVFEVLSFVMFVKFGYMYFSEHFYGGVTLETIFSLHYGYLGSIILYILTWAVSAAAMFMRQSKQVQAERGAVA